MSYAMYLNGSKKHTIVELGFYTHHTEINIYSCSRHVVIWRVVFMHVYLYGILQFSFGTCMLCFHFWLFMSEHEMLLFHFACSRCGNVACIGEVVNTNYPQEFLY